MANIPNPGGGLPAPTSTTNQNSNTLGLPSNKQFYLWAISALLLIALADPYPNIAIGFTLLLILGVLLVHSDNYISLAHAAFGG